MGAWYKFISMTLWIAKSLYLITKRYFKEANDIVFEQSSGKIEGIKDCVKQELKENETF
jgi:hypothetical protein